MVAEDRRVAGRDDERNAVIRQAAMNPTDPVSTKSNRFMPDACVVLGDLTLGYHRDRPAVHRLSGVLRRGSLTALTGPNGSGKSTLMKGIVGLLEPLAGTCTLGHGARPAYLPQSSELDRSFPARVVDLVSLGLWPRRGLLGRHRRQDRETVESALCSVGLEGFARRPIDALSGGQLQRALFARVLVQDADLILLDEPFNAIDAKTVVDLLTLIERWHAEGRTVLAALHELELVRERFPETLLLARRPVAWGRTETVLTPENLRRARRLQELGREAGHEPRDEESSPRPPEANDPAAAVRRPVRSVEDAATERRRIPG